jgi:hypothetical protein
MPNVFDNTQIATQITEHITEVQDLLFHEEGILDLVSDAPELAATNLGVRVPLITDDNPSMGMGDANGDAFAIPGAPGLNSFNVRYCWLNSGLTRTYASILNEKNSSLSSQNKMMLTNQVECFRDLLSFYVGRSDGKGTLATASAAIAGAVITCNGGTDTVGVSRVKEGAYVSIFDSTGTVRRTPLNDPYRKVIAVDYTANTITLDAAVAGVIAGDIIVPQNTLASPLAPKGLPFLISENFSGGFSYFGIPGNKRFIQPSAHDFGGTLTAAGMHAAWSKHILRMRADKNKERKNYVLIMSESGANQYYSTLNVAPFTPQFNFGNTGGRPKQDAGFDSFEQTFFGIEMRSYASVMDGRMYCHRKGTIKATKWKSLGDIISQFDNSEFATRYSSTGQRLTALERHMDWGGDYFITQRNKQAVWYNFGYDANITLKAV